MDSSSIIFTLLHPTLSPSLATSIIVIIITFLFLTPRGIAWALSRTTIPGPTASLSPLSGPIPHTSLSSLARSLNARHLMAFSVGLTRFIVSSHPDTAREILSSSAFADRPVKQSARRLRFHRAMGFAPPGDYWRNLRRISSSHLFSPRRVGSLEKRRSEIGEGMVKSLMGRNGGSEVRRMLRFGALNGVMMSVFGRRYEFGSGEGLELEGMVEEGYELLGVFDWGDHLPVLGWFDLHGLRRRCGALVARVEAFVGRIVEEKRRRRRGEEDESGDFVEVLLGFDGEERLSDSDMVAVLWVR